MKLNWRRKDLFIPLWSMSDVAFLLLIFIMLVSLMNYRREVKIDYPEAEMAKNVNVDNNLEIWVDLSGRLFLNGEPSNLAGIEEGIIKAYSTAPDTRVHIIADRSTPFENIHMVLDILQLLEYRVVSFVAKNE